MRISSSQAAISASHDAIFSGRHVSIKSRYSSSCSFTLTVATLSFLARNKPMMLRIACTTNRNRERTKMENLLPVPVSPVVVDRLVTITGSHLLRTGDEGIHCSPIPFNAFSISSTGSWNVIERKLGPTRGPMTVDVTFRHGIPNASVRPVQSHICREFLHPLRKFFVPLTGDIVDYEDSFHGRAC